jgi:hypothetical protein
MPKSYRPFAVVIVAFALLEWPYSQCETTIQIKVGPSAMSFDIFVQDIPAAVKSVGEIPEDVVPKPVAARSAVVAAISKVAPEVKFYSPEWEPSMATATGST